VTDACVVLGYIDPDYFLGGGMEVSVDLARTTVERDIADPLGLPVHEAASAVLDLAVERMVTAIEGITLSQGIDPATAVMIGGGGGGGLYSVGIARRLGVRQVVLPPVAAALSATGALISDLQTTFATIDVLTTADFEYERAAGILARLRREAERFLAGAGAAAEDSEVRFAVEARYPHQVWEIEVPLRHGRLETAAQLDDLREDFHATHEELFAVRDSAAHVELVTWRAQVRCTLRRRALGQAVPEPSTREVARSRGAFFPALGLVDVPVRTHESLGVAERVAGPVIVESPVTTVVLDERAAVELTPNGSLRIDCFAAARGPDNIGAGG
jgi:N-methylhydantoinase A